MSSTEHKKDDSAANGSTKHDDKPDDKEKQPAGGYDANPIPYAEAGYTIKITIHRAQNLPMADINSLSSDPYVITQIYTSLPTRHKEDPPLKHRTTTIRRDTNPEWNDSWVVANVPKSGFKLKCRLYDEDPGDHDDRLGNAHIDVPHLDEKWEGFEEKSFKLKKRMGSKRAYLTQAIATGLTIRHAMAGYLVVSIKVLGRTESQHGGRLYTVGPISWTKHHSPLLGRMTGKKTPGKDGEGKDDDGKPKPESYK
jgi:Ca2+-dependent lipid-binding protein